MTPRRSVKGVVTVAGRVVLLRNERDEWELPGGRPEAGESDHEALAREIREELGVDVEVEPEPLDRYDFAPVPGRVVAIVTYACGEPRGDHPLVLSDEHVAVATFAPADAMDLSDLPVGYRDSIRRRFSK
ncbi:MAG: NUDIX hydrolase [Actinomycetota bacterium]